MTDPFMETLGLSGEIPAPGRALVRGTVKPEHLNMHGTAHGGLLFTMADAAFALASNSHGIAAVALDTHMEFVRPVRAGDELEAAAEELSLGNRTALYRVELRRAGELVALFTGTVYRKAR